MVQKKGPKKMVKKKGPKQMVQKMVQVDLFQCQMTFTAYHESSFSCFTFPFVRTVYQY